MNSYPSQVLEITLFPETAKRLDKALADAVSEKYTLSRSRLKKLIEAGCVISSDNGLVATLKTKVIPNSNWEITLEAPEITNISAEDLKIEIAFEDEHLIVINKAAGMVVHPAPGSPSGTLVNALMFHCGSSLSGVGGRKRPGIVHRIDKNTSGLLVVAKTDVAHSGLASQFENHSISRHYKAFCYGVINKLDTRLNSHPKIKFEKSEILMISGNISRHRFDRKKMAVFDNIGRRAVTRCKNEVVYGEFATRLDCWLETGRTHQIRVHLAHIGHGLIGDPVYGSRRKFKVKSLEEKDVKFLDNFRRQALHATSLAFIHPVTNEPVSFNSDLPKDLMELDAILKKIR
ncbi:MAG: RluA family pseudouridine synthase [Paracoccaceae bacterium]|nr:RluA family pseudouridine synthase [Paracoccaceae bacterium]|tara:strand:- start:363 stop:1400 length:1038 start_codon:yes stop_codon:yes gene_type:complete